MSQIFKGTMSSIDCQRLPISTEETSVGKMIRGKIFSRATSLALAALMMFGGAQPGYANSAPELWSALDPVGYGTDESGKGVIQIGRPSDSHSFPYASRAFTAGEVLTLEMKNSNPTAQVARIAAGVPVPQPLGPCAGIVQLIHGELEVELGRAELESEGIGVSYSAQLALQPLPNLGKEIRAILKFEVDCLGNSSQILITVKAPPDPKPTVRWFGQERKVIMSSLQRTLASFSESDVGLTRQQKLQVKSSVDANPNAEKFICTGIRYFDQPMSVNIMVRKRAKAACDYAKQLNPALSTWFQSKPTQAKSYAGKVLLTLKVPVEPVPFDSIQSSTKDLKTSPRTPKSLDIQRFEVFESSSQPGVATFRIYLAAHQHSLNFVDGSSKLGFKFDYDGDGKADAVVTTNESSTASFGTSFAVINDTRGGSCVIRYEANPFYPSNLSATPMATFSIPTSCIDTENYFGIMAFSESVLVDGDSHPEAGFERFQAPWSFGRVH